MKSGSWAAALVLVACGAGIPSSANAQLNQPLHRDGWILAAAHAPGLQGSIWRTDLWIFVRSSSTTPLTLKFCEAGKDNSNAAAHSVDISGTAYVYYFEDVVDRFLHVGTGSWLGAIHYTGPKDLQVWARVYSVSPDGKRSYGQIVEGIPTAHMTPDDDPWNSRAWQWMSALKHTADGRFRVNIGVVNPTAIASKFVANIYADAEDLPAPGAASATTTVPPFSMAQLTDPFAGANGGEWNEYRVRVHSNEEGSGLFAYASVVDNATNDAYFVRGVQLFRQDEKRGLNCTAHRDGWILAAAHAPGLQGSIWRTDLWLARSAESTGSATLTFCRSATDNTTEQPFTVSFPSGQNVLYFEDVVDHFLHVGDVPWQGAIHYTATDDVQVWARVYSISPDGQTSYGQIVEGIPTTDMSPSVETQPATDHHQYLFAVRHTSDGRFRVNVGLVNPTGTAARFEARIFDRTGNTPAGGSSSTNVTVPPYSMIQLTDPFASVSGGDWSDFAIRVACFPQGCGSFAYASVVDNATNDAYFVRGVKRLPYPPQ